MKTPKFQVGDTVQIRSDIEVGEGRVANFVPSMQRYRGQSAVIRSVNRTRLGDVYYKVDGNDWGWEEGFFEDPIPCGVKVDLTGLL